MAFATRPARCGCAQCRDGIFRHTEGGKCAAVVDDGRHAQRRQQSNNIRRYVRMYLYIMHAAMEADRLLAEGALTAQRRGGG